MAYRIFLYFGLMAVGWLLSSRNLIHKKLMNRIALVQTVFLFGLIFVMGIRVGMDEQVISSIGEIGLKAFIFAVFTCSFSVLFVHIARKKFIRDVNITGGRND